MKEAEALASCIGKTITALEGLEIGTEQFVFKFDDGTELMLRYDHDCCASCNVVQIDGDPSDLVGAPLAMCEAVASEELPTAPMNEYEDSFTWTFYKFATTTGYVTVRWYGSSNGYYSERCSVYLNGEHAWDW